jgi:putative transposase
VTERQNLRVHERWARLRFSVIGQLLAAPPAKRTLRGELAKLAEREWRHPVSEEPVRFSISTIERWYRREHDGMLSPRRGPPRRTPNQRQKKRK